MVYPETRLFCRLDGLTTAVREQKRLKVLEELGLALEAQTIPVFEEATQTAARFLEAPICILGLMGQDREWIKSAVGLSRVGLMNELATSRQIPRSESFSAHVVDSHQVLMIRDALVEPAFTKSMLVQHYGIRAYLGTPLLSSGGVCLGTLAVMDLVPRNFSSKDIDFLELMARWSLSEFERNHLLSQIQPLGASAEQSSPLYWFLKSPLEEPKWQGREITGKASNGNTNNNLPSLTRPPANPSSAESLKVKLLTQLSQELRTPLTSVMGMASVLGREVYGPLTTKQKEYLEIIHHSGQHLVSLVDEILALGNLDENSQKLDLASVDIEMLCQQAINSLQKVATQRQQQIRLWVEPSNRIWLLDKDKVRQMLYYLLFSVIHSAEAGSVISLHVSRKNEKLNIALSVSHPWLGEGLQQVELYSSAISGLADNAEAISDQSEFAQTRDFAPLQEPSVSSLQPPNQLLLNSSQPRSTSIMEGLTQHSSLSNNSRENLGLLLSCQLAEIHGGEILVQGSPESGYRYVVNLPQLAAVEEGF